MLITDNANIHTKISQIIDDTPIKAHLLKFSSEEFKSMIKQEGFNVGKEAFNNNIILFGIENYYGLIGND